MSWSSGTNTIKEGDESKSLTLQMLEVKKQGGGTEYFVRKNDVKLGTKSVTQNGTYTAAADEKYGFSQFSVNVRGGNGSADSHGKPTGGDIKPGGAGSAVVGTDPETDNDVVVGVDEDGNLVNTPLPSSIVLVTNPTKMDYNDGETIDLSGAVVTAKMADGTTWTDADHPNGHVSCSCDPAAADISQASTGGGTVPADNPLDVPSFDFASVSKFWIQNKRPGRSYNFTQVFDGFEHATVIREAKNPHVIAASASNSSKYSGYGTAEDPTTIPATSAISSFDAYTLNGKTVYYITPHSGAHSFSWTASNVPINDVGMSSKQCGAAAWLMVYGDYAGAAGAQTITLNWARPGDGKVLSTTMEITVGAHSTESSSGTEGSGGGGSF